MSEVEKLTPAQANTLRKRMEELAKEEAKKQGASYPDLVSLQIAVGLMPAYRAISEFTAGPGEAGFCEGCKWWMCLPFGQDCDCQHKEFNGKTCPIDRWGEREEGDVDESH